MKIIKHYLFGMPLILVLTFFCNGQEKIRKIEALTLMKEQPIELVSSEVGSKTFDNENKILADENWLKNLKLNLKNVSSKTIVYIKIFLQVEPQGKMQYPLRIPVTFGQAPLSKTIKSSSNLDIEEIKLLKPNESVKLSIKSYLLDSSDKFIQKNAVEGIDRIKVVYDFVVFDDDTAWSQGQWMRRNPTNDRKWDVIDISRKEGDFSQKLSIINSALILTSGSIRNFTLSGWTINPSFFLKTI